MFSLFVTYFFSDNIKINELLSLRPLTWRFYFNLFIENPLFLIAKQKNSVALDNSYLKILFLNGPIVWIFVDGIYRKIMNKLFTNKSIIFLMIYISIYSFFENIMLALYINIVVLIAFNLLYKKENSVKKYKYQRRFLKC